jgi:hypothetical protein
MKKLNPKGISHLLIPLLVVVLVGALGGAFLLLRSNAATPAAATTTTSTSTSTLYGPVNICMSLYHNECLATHGVGNSVTVQTSSWADWKWSYSGYSGGYQTYMYQNAAGRCLEAVNTTITLTIASTACSKSNNSERWKEIPPGGTQPEAYLNVGHNCWLATDQITHISGERAFCYSGTPGKYVDWHWVE